MHTKFPSTVMVLGVVSSEGDVMPLFFFQRGLRVNASDYIQVLEDTVKPWMDRVANGRPYVFQQDSASAHKAQVTQKWLPGNVPCRSLIPGLMATQLSRPQPVGLPRVGRG